MEAASRQPPAASRISVIVPTLEEEARVAGTLRGLAGRGFHEVLVVDGGSRDRTRELAAALATRLLEEGPGIARQLNRGAAAAVGEVLLFHPADLVLPDGAMEAIRGALRDPRVVGGAFRLALDSPRAVYGAIAFCANLRNFFGFGPFGDQAIWVLREVFERVGGFREGAVLEDLDLVRRLRREGRFRILRPAVRSSVRRWERDGVLPTTLSHLAVSALVLLGAPERARALRTRLVRRREAGEGFAKTL